MVHSEFSSVLESEKLFACESRNWQNNVANEVGCEEAHMLSQGFGCPELFLSLWLTLTFVLLSKPYLVRPFQN